MDLNSCLPQDMIIEGVDDIFYDIGLSFQTNKDMPTKRNLIHNPIVILTFLLTLVILKIVTLNIIVNEDVWAIYLGDIGYMYGMKNLFNSFQIVINISPIIFLLINYNNFKRHIKPTYVTVFQVMSGSITPMSIGLNSEHDLKILLKATNNLLTINNFNCIAILPITVVFVGLIYIKYTTLTHFFVFGLPNICLQVSSTVC